MIGRFTTTGKDYLLPGSAGIVPGEGITIYPQIVIILAAVAVLEGSGNLVATCKTAYTPSYKLPKWTCAAYTNDK